MFRVVCNYYLLSSSSNSRCSSLLCLGVNSSSNKRAALMFSLFLRPEFLDLARDFSFNFDSGLWTFPKGLLIFLYFGAVFCPLGARFSVSCIGGSSKRCRWSIASSSSKSEIVARDFMRFLTDAYASFFYSSAHLRRGYFIVNRLLNIFK